jgi:hypothetical protein
MKRPVYMVLVCVRMCVCVCVCLIRSAFDCVCALRRGIDDWYLFKT